jgi:hypothetical protein
LNHLGAAEPLPLNQRVPGSSPGAPTKFSENSMHGPARMIAAGLDFARRCLAQPVFCNHNPVRGPGNSR